MSRSRNYRKRNMEAFSVRDEEPTISKRSQRIDDIHRDHLYGETYCADACQQTSDFNRRMMETTKKLKSLNVSFPRTNNVVPHGRA